jgi:hypothetical protein
MKRQAIEEAEKYMKRSLESQQRLGYSASVDGDTYKAAVTDAARAFDRLLRAQRRTRAAA